MRPVSTIVVAICLVVVGGCDFLDPARPTAQPDADVFGNLIEVTRNPDAPDLWTAVIRVGPPRALRAADEETGKPTPAVEKGLMVTVTVGPDTIVIANDGSASLEDIPSGTEVVVLPVPGTTQIHGSTELWVDADMLMDFATYSLWQLPKLVASDVTFPDDPLLINSSGAPTTKSFLSFPFPRREAANRAWELKFNFSTSGCFVSSACISNPALIPAMSNALSV